MTHLFLIGVVAGLLFATHPQGVCIEKYDTADDIGSVHG